MDLEVRVRIDTSLFFVLFCGAHWRNVREGGEYVFSCCAFCSCADQL